MGIHWDPSLKVWLEGSIDDIFTTWANMLTAKGKPFQLNFSFSIFDNLKWKESENDMNQPPKYMHPGFSNAFSVWEKPRDIAKQEWESITSPMTDQDTIIKQLIDSLDKITEEIRRTNLTQTPLGSPIVLDHPVHLPYELEDLRASIYKLLKTTVDQTLECIGNLLEAKLPLHGDKIHPDTQHILNQLLQIFRTSDTLVEFQHRIGLVSLTGSPDPYLPTYTRSEVQKLAEKAYIQGYEAALQTRSRSQESTRPLPDDLLEDIELDIHRR